VRRILPLLAVLLCLIAIAALTATPVLTGGGATPGRLWRGRYTLLIREGVEWRGALAGVGLTDVLGLSTSHAAFTVFGDELERVPLTALSMRLDELDPRRDPYIENLHRFFVGPEGWRVVFPRASRSILAFMIRVSAALGRYGGSWVLADWSLARAALTVILAVFATALLALRMPEGLARMSFAVGFLPWLTPIVTGGSSELLLFLLSAAIWARVYPAVIDLTEALFVRRERPGKPPRGVWLAAVPTVVAILPGATSWAVVLATASPVAGLAAYGAGRRLHLAFYFHRIFSPLRLVRHEVPVWVKGRHLVPIALLVLLGPLLAASAVRDMGAPAPLAVKGIDGLDLGDLHRLWLAGQNGDLPNLADYAAHMAYQRALEYGLPYRFPEGDVTTSSFSRTDDGRRVVRTEEVVLRFDQAWLDDLIRSVDPNSIEGMLLDQGRAVRVRYKPLGDTRLDAARRHTAQPNFSWWTGLTVVIFFAIAFIPFDLKWRPMVSSVSVKRAA
jgi:hypothetical protein